MRAPRALPGGRLDAQNGTPISRRILREEESVRRIKPFVSLVAAAVLLATLPAAHPALAQVVGTGTIEVIAQDDSGLGVPGVTVVAQAGDAVTTREGVTDAEGRAVLAALEPSADYVVTTELSGFTPTRNENVLVRSGQTATVRVQLTVGGLTEAVQVSAEAPLVDTKSAITGQDITLELTESLPTGRTYQSYFQFVPGVLPADPESPNNPAVKSGVNYTDIGGNLGVSSDNFVYFNGIDVTDPVTGRTGAELNTEIIQEMKVLTGGIPAEFAGTPGLLSNVITKSGSNAFHGSANYFFQDDNLQAENKNSTEQKFSTFDAAFTLGGPIVPDRAWFFGSYRRLERDDDVTSLDTEEFLRSTTNKQNQGYAKGTWTPTRSDTVSFLFLSDPTDTSGQRDRDITNARSAAQELGGDRYAVNYSRLWGNALIEGAYSLHNGELSQFSEIREPLTTVIYRETDQRTLFDEQLGGFGSDLINERDSQGARGSVQWTIDRHTVKGGLEWARHENFRNTTFLESAQQLSLASHLAGITGGELATGSFSDLGFDPFNTSDFTGLIRTINGLPNRSEFYDLYDANGDGTITSAELGSQLTFGSTAGNREGKINYDRTLQVTEGPQETRSDGLTFFVQDQIELGRLALNVGVRAERWEHFATTGEDIFTFDWEFAPRLSAVYDLMGDGRQKVSAFYGRYYDPIRNNMTNFAGTLTGSVLDEQVFLNDEWVTFRTRGGAVQQDAFFAPTTQTPYTDDLAFGYEVDLGRNMSFGTTYTYRRTRDILEDYDLGLYAVDTEGTTEGYPGPIDDPNALWLGLDYFGYAENPGSNFVIATLEGGERNYHGLELTFRRRFSDNWQALAWYSYNHLRGNTNSDSNADFQGDTLYLDPRAPNQYGRQPGSIPHVFALGGSYVWPIGIELGGAYKWNVGTIASRTALASGRNLPVQVEEPFEFAGINDFWLAPDAVGSLDNPSYGQLDLRLQYKPRIGLVGLEVFVDVFNVLDNQDAIRNQDLVAGTGEAAFGEGIRFLDPRRFFLGTRVSF
ncbi:MAG: TonB-dependent receptor [Luteitalea sp.]|nr:TonB-dependent receptor [Luteitalea sp.]